MAAAADGRGSVTGVWAPARGVLAAAVALAGLLSGPAPAAGLPGTPTPAAVPQVGCPGTEAPPPPAAVEEAGPPVPPLPWPAQTVGGTALGTCGTVGPATPPGVDAVSYVVADLDSGAVLAARAPHARERPASTLKVLLSLVVAARLNPDAVVEGQASDLRVDGSRAGIGPGGRYTVRQLMAGLLLNSGNDTAEALARALGGDAATLAAMTATARADGALDTRPATPSGLDGPGMASSAYDLALLFRLALRQPLFASTLATRTLPFPGYDGRPGFTMGSTEQFAPRYPGSIGSKSGFTDAARHTLIAAAQRDGRRLVVVLMRGEQRPVPMWRQAASLLDQAFASATAAPVGTLVEQAPATPTPGPTPAPDPTAAPPTTGTATGPLLAAAGAALLVAAALAVTAALRRRRPDR